jgi:hypothetical protein
MFDKDTNSIIYYVCHFFKNCREIDTTCHHTFKGAHDSGKMWVTQDNKANDYYVQEIEVEFDD